MAAVPLFPGSQGLLDTVFQTYPTRSRRLRAFDAKSRLGVSPLILQPARDFQRRKFVHNSFRAVGSLWFFHVSLSRPEFTFAGAPCVTPFRFFPEIGRASCRERV